MTQFIDVDKHRQSSYRHKYDCIGYISFKSS